MININLGQTAGLTAWVGTMVGQYTVFIFINLFNDQYRAIIGSDFIFHIETDARQWSTVCRVDTGFHGCAIQNGYPPIFHGQNGADTELNFSFA